MGDSPHCPECGRMMSFSDWQESPDNRCEECRRVDVIWNEDRSRDDKWTREEMVQRGDHVLVHTASCYPMPHRGERWREPTGMSTVIPVPEFLEMADKIRERGGEDVARPAAVCRTGGCPERPKGDGECWTCPECSLNTVKLIRIPENQGGGWCAQLDPLRLGDGETVGEALRNLGADLDAEDPKRWYGKA